MDKIVQATSRGQITLPKRWRDKYETVYYKVEMLNDSIVLTPLLEKKIKKTDLEADLQTSWEQYQKGEFIDEAALMKKYGL